MLVMAGTDCSANEFDTDGMARRLIHEIAFALVEASSPIAVDAVIDNGVRTLRVQTDESGLGRLIGSQGRTVRAIRTILTGFAAKSHRVYGLDIVGDFRADRAAE